MMDVIISCDCGDTPVFARQAYMSLTGHTAPKVYSGVLGITKLVYSLPNGSSAREYISDYARVKRPFAFWFVIDEDGNITKGTDLFTGHKVE